MLRGSPQNRPEMRPGGCRNQSGMTGANERPGPGQTAVTAPSITPQPA